MTQAALASATGIHRTHISRAENGQVPSVIALIEIARGLGIEAICKGGASVRTLNAERERMD